jgi:uncharacterized membrane protein YhhN
VPDIDYARATRRLYYFTIGVGLLGLPVASWRARWTGAAGWLVGVGLSLGNLWLWQRLASKLSGSERNKGPSGAALVMRIVAVLAIAYVIVNTLKINGMALVLGLLASAVGAIAEIVFELFRPLAARLKQHL